MFSNPNLSFTLFLYFTLLITHQTLSITSTQCHKDDGKGLLAFKAGIISDPSEMLKSWEPKTDCCEWAGVTCSTDPNNRRVIGLSVVGNGEPNGILSGQISPSLGKLKYLNSFHLWYLGNLTGPFPKFLFTLPNLTTIAIVDSKLYGPIPKSIGNMINLTRLILFRNQFSGTILGSLVNLVQLTELTLGYNHFSGVVPISFSQLRELVLLELSFNQFTGTLPDDMFQSLGISHLSLSNNKFTGKIPQSWSGLSARYIDLSSNKFIGELPLLGMQYIDHLNLSRNQFSGGVPESYGTLQRISNLDLSHNKLNGSSIPQIDGVLSFLDLSYNNFRLNNIPNWIGEASYLSELRMEKCGIKIKLNNWKPMGMYFNIDLSENQITGNPLQLLDSTVNFKASKNKMKFDLKHMKVGKNLKSLDISNNLVFGTVPKTVWRLDGLNVSYNHLCGKLPATKFLVSSFVGNDCLCGAPLPPLFQRSCSMLRSR